MIDANTIGENARDRALRAIARHVLGDVPAGCDDLRSAVAETLTFYEDCWLGETLDEIEQTAVAEIDPDAWSDERLPRLTQDEVDVQTDALVRRALRDPEAPAAFSAGRGMRR